MVDLVVIFRQTTPITLVEAVRRNLLVKGADYRLDDVIGADLLQSYGGKVLLAELREGFSTTDMITRIRGLGSRHDRRLPGRVIGSA
jgi:D-beta-D-heptose 7-phosphate kinase/D-beta-D-heptose 1-phosphate adenosyltransferase